MKIEVTIKTTLEVGKKDVALLKNASAAELLQTAQLQNAPVKVTIDK